MSTPYRTCPDCGCALDPGERCDCTTAAASTEAPASARATAEAARITPPERAYHGTIVGVDLARSRDFTATAHIARHRT